MQCSFAPGRNITDNIITMGEDVHTIRIMKGTRGFFAIKVDLEKAYDCLKWDFILDTLMDIGLSQGLISPIMKCVFTSLMQIAWHGSLSTNFNPSREVHQRDPISPHLFVL